VSRATLHCGDALTLDLGGRFDLVYADPPYGNCRFKYARGNNSRQWGRDARADFLRELIARVDSLREPHGVGAVSIAVPELRLMSLFPSKARTFAWVKPYAPNRPGVWPTYAWEPVVAWGRFPNRLEQRAAKKTPKDWLHLSPAVPKKGGHENPKPDGFADWVLDLTLGPRTGKVCELFAGSAPICLAAIARNMEAVAVEMNPDTVEIARHRIGPMLCMEAVA
jgi:methylase of polypeptide subunit release factors